MSYNAEIQSNNADLQTILDFETVGTLLLGGARSSDFDSVTDMALEGGSL